MAESNQLLLKLTVSKFVELIKVCKQSVDNWYNLSNFWQTSSHFAIVDNICLRLVEKIIWFLTFSKQLSLDEFGAV